MDVERKWVVVVIVEAYSGVGRRRTDRAEGNGDVASFTRLEVEATNA